MNAAPKVGLVHLGVIGLHPLHSPPFMRMCFYTQTHFFSLMVPYISHLVANPMLGLRHKVKEFLNPPIKICLKILNEK
jgi:hypothetical protein